jgi:hypothetical protein
LNGERAEASTSLTERASVSDAYTDLLDFVLAHGGCAGARTANGGPYTFDGYHLLVTCGCGEKFTRWAVQEDLDADLLRMALLAF